MGNADSTWIEIPDAAVDLNWFFDQFWSIINWFSPIVLPLLGLAVCTVVVGSIIRNAFGSSS